MCRRQRSDQQPLKAKEARLFTGTEHIHEKAPDSVERGSVSVIWPIGSQSTSATKVISEPMEHSKVAGLHTCIMLVTQSRTRSAR